MDFIDLVTQQARIRERVAHRIDAVLAHGTFIMGPEVYELEEKLAIFCGAKNAVTCANGTDAIELALMALGVSEGDAIFCPSFTFAATAEVVPQTKAVPVFCDVDPRTYNLCPDSLLRAIRHADGLGLNPRAVITVDLFGLPANYDAIMPICADHHLSVISDSAQGFGSVFKGRNSGTIGDITTTSFFPAKPLGCYGDGGAIFTNDTETADMLRSLRFHGKGDDKYDNIRLGRNSRLDTLQAAILLEKLAIFTDELDKRQKVADRYSAHLEDIVLTPFIPEGSRSSWAQYTVQLQADQNRARIMEGLQKHGVPTAVYYPRPLHLQTAYRRFPADPAGLPNSERVAKKVFSLPMHPYLTSESQDIVIQNLKELLHN